MQSDQNQAVKLQLIKQVKQLQSKQTALNFFMGYDFPDKQKALKSFWEQLIERIMHIKQQIYLTYKDLQAITTIHGYKPAPLKKILLQLKRDSVYVREEDVTQDVKIQKKDKPWFSSIMSFAWAKPNPPQFQWPFTFHPEQKIVGWKPKQRKKRDLLIYFQSLFVEQHSRLMRNFVRQISEKIMVDETSVNIILRQLVRLRQVYIGQVEDLGDSVIVYHVDRKKILDENFIKAEKLRCMLQAQVQRLNTLYEKSSESILNFKTKAKDALLIDDMKKAKVFIAQSIAQDKHRQQINIRIQVFRSRISQMQLNQMNKSSIDLMQQAQKVYEQCAVDSEKFDQVMQKEREMKQQSEQMNMKFQELADSQGVEDEVDKLLEEIEIESKRKVEEKRVHVVVPEEHEVLQQL